MGQIVSLKQGRASLTLLPSRGGLVTSLVLADPRGEPVDVLWRAADFDTTGSGWPMGGMPLLFPFAGRVFHEGQPLRYALGGEVRNMPLHGFAYGLPWQVEQETADTVVCQLTDNPSTQVLYPFKFAARTRFHLEEKCLEARVEIECHGTLDPRALRMPIAPGWHPFFKMPLRPLSRLGECKLITSAQHKVRVTQQGAAGKSSPFPEDSSEKDASLADPMFRNLILAHHGSPQISVQDRDSKITVQLEWDPADAIRYVVLWSKEGENFHCLEPWMSLPDPLAAGHQTVWLSKGESFAFTTRIKLV